MVKVFNGSDREKKGGKEKQLLVSCEGHESLYKKKLTHIFWYYQILYGLMLYTAA